VAYQPRLLKKSTILQKWADHQQKRVAHWNKYLKFIHQNNQWNQNNVQTLIWPAVCILFTPFLKSISFFSRGFFGKTLSLCMASIQERFLIKCGSWWRVYGRCTETLIRVDSLKNDSCTAAVTIEGMNIMISQFDQKYFYQAQSAA
jgi:hypothetical protein